MTTPRTRKSTVTEMIRTHQAAAKALPEPVRPLSADARRYFDKIVASRESDTWTELDVAHATALAQMELQVELSLADIEREGRCIESGKGALTQHPAVKNLSALSGSVRALVTSLGLSAAQRGIGAGPTQQGRNLREVNARRADDQSPWSQFA